jgi:Tol biopolymer transport system component
MRQAMQKTLAGFVTIICFGCQATLAGEDEIGPRWSSDGEYIYYYSYRHPDDSLVHDVPSVTMRMRSDGSDETVLSEGAHRNWWLWPLPCETGDCDSAKLVVVSERDATEAFGGSNIYLFDPQEGSYHTMSKSKPEVGEWALDPSLSSDGNLMAYIWRSGFRDRSSSRLMVLSRVDQTTFEVTTVKNVDDAAILPDATGIIYSPNEREIHLVELDTMTSELIYAFEESPDPFMDGLSISQNGQHIAFSYGPDGLESSEIYRLSIAGDQLDRLTNNGVPDLRPAWAPDNRRIAFNRMLSPDLDWNDILVIDSKGGEESRLTNNIAEH